MTCPPHATAHPALNSQYLLCHQTTKTTVPLVSALPPFLLVTATAKCHPSVFAMIAPELAALLSALPPRFCSPCQCQTSFLELAPVLVLLAYNPPGASYCCLLESVPGAGLKRSTVGFTHTPAFPACPLSLQLCTLGGQLLRNGPLPHLRSGLGCSPLTVRLPLKLDLQDPKQRPSPSQRVSSALHSW